MPSAWLLMQYQQSAVGLWLAHHIESRNEGSNIVKAGVA